MVFGIGNIKIRKNHLPLPSGYKKLAFTASIMNAFLQASAAISKHLGYTAAVCPSAAFVQLSASDASDHILLD